MQQEKVPKSSEGTADKPRDTDDYAGGSFITGGGLFRRAAQGDDKFFPLSRFIASLVLIIAVLVAGLSTDVKAKEDSRLGLNAPAQLTWGEQTLYLNGEGRRIRHFLVLYGCALYVTEPGLPFADIVALDTPMAFRIEVTFDMLPADMPLSWVSELQNAVSEADFRVLQSTYSALGSGDVVLIWHEPSAGTTVSVNGEKRITVKSEFLIRAFVSLWLSDDPVSDDLRAALLSADEDDL